MRGGVASPVLSDSTQMHVCLLKIYCFCFLAWALRFGSCGCLWDRGEKCELEQCNEEGVKIQASCISCRENGWRPRKAIAVRSKRVMASNQATRE